ncbi:hypothetical protein N9T21_03835 [Candidatus Pelagibacter sp.]|nr:hypothetical protein [Candidatus Pelagibacter sp.]
MTKLKKIRIFAMIPARIGSQRLKYKNLALINKKPLISYAISAAKKAKIFEKIILNSDDKIFQSISKLYNIDFYLRKKKFGSSNAKSDDLVKDFLYNNNCDVVMWINPIAPLLDFNDIKKIKKYFIQKKLNSLITTHKVNVHSLRNIKRNILKPINFKFNTKFEKTQDLKPITLMNYCVMMWRSKSFLNNMKNKGSAILHGNVGFYDLDMYKSFIVKNKFDLNLIEKLMNSNLKKKSKISLQN